MKLHTVSFGCQMNVADSEEMSRALADRGFGFTQEQKEADAILINTCTVRQHAEDRAFSLVGNLREWKEANPERLLIIAGCAAERTKDNLQKRFPYVDLVVGAKAIEQFPEIIEEALKEKYSWGRDNEGNWPGNGFKSFDPSTPLRAGIATGSPAATPRNDAIAYVTTMRGCNYSCSYCIVPYVRGRESYRDPEAIAKEIEARVASGAKEVLLLGQTVNSYFRPGWNFAKLLKRVAQIQGVERIRFMSPHPYYMTEELIEVMATTPQICEHLHLPLQSGSDRILNLMRRNYTKKKYAAIVGKFRTAIPGAAVTTDIIAGFPSETEEDFNQSLELMRELDFDGAYCFKFSPRQGTPAASLEGALPEKVIEERHARLLEFTENMAGQKVKNYLDKTLEVLFEEDNRGRTRANRWIELEEGRGEKNKGKKGEVGKWQVRGQIRRVKITSAKNRKLFGRLVATVA